MTKRRAAGIMMFGRKAALKYPVSVVARASGTGTETRFGTLTVVVASTGISTGSVYINIASGSVVGTKCGTGR